MGIIDPVDFHFAFLYERRRIVCGISLAWSRDGANVCHPIRCGYVWMAVFLLIRGSGFFLAFAGDKNNFSQKGSKIERPANQKASKPENKQKRPEAIREVFIMKKEYDFSKSTRNPYETDGADRLNLREPMCGPNPTTRGAPEIHASGRDARRASKKKEHRPKNLADPRSNSRPKPQATVNTI